MISFIIPTRNRPEALRRTIDAIARACAEVRAEVEVIAIDNASDHPPALPASHSPRLHIHLIALRENLGAAARNLGASRVRTLFEIVLPQIRGTLLVGVVLSFVTMLSVLSVPLMINPNAPTMITVDIAYRINTHGDYGVANALCLASLALAAAGAWFYLRHAVAKAEGG